MSMGQKSWIWCLDDLMYEQLQNKTTSIYNAVTIGNSPSITVKEELLHQLQKYTAAWVEEPTRQVTSCSFDQLSVVSCVVSCWDKLKGSNDNEWILGCVNWRVTEK